MLLFTDLAVTVPEADDYAAARGWSNWTGDDQAKTEALRRGQDFIAFRYNQRWASEWDNDDAPENVKYAIISAARRELVTPGSLTKDKKRGGKIKQAGAGSAMVVFADNAPADTVFDDVDGLLSGLIKPARSGSVDLLRV